MSCHRFQTDGMRFLDGEMSEEEKRTYEAHVNDCPECRSELKELGRIVELTDELRFRPPDDEFWEGYWENIYRRAERNTGFLLLVIGVIGVAGNPLAGRITAVDVAHALVVAEEEYPILDPHRVGQVGVQVQQLLELARAGAIDPEPSHPAAAISLPLSRISAVAAQDHSSVRSE